MIGRKRTGDVLVLSIENPPVNALGAAVRAGLSQALGEALADASVRAIVIRGEGRYFSSGADISEFGKPPAAPILPTLIAEIEASPKPVIAAIHGAALGGGLELVLACHYRLSTASANLGLPEVNLGLLPGAGGTQRLPRLIGAEAALDMIVSGEPIKGARAGELGLVDRVSEDVVADAIAFAASTTETRRTGALAVGVAPGWLERAAAKHARKLETLEAAHAAVEAVKASAEQSLDEGLKAERALFTALLNSAQSKALRYMFFAERKAGHIDGLPANTATRAIGKVGVIGAGTMGGGIAMNFLSAGIATTILDTTSEALDRGVKAMRGNYDASMRKGRLTGEQVERAMALLEPTLDFAALGACDLIIEAVYEDMSIKKEVFARLDGVAKPGAILASNTSYLDIDEMAAATIRPQDVLGLHFFSPANVMRLLEVVRGIRTADDVLATAMALARTIGKTPVVARVCHGFIGNRMLRPRQVNAIALVLEGASPEQVDRVHTDFGMPMGPFQMSDLAGLDIGWHRDPDRIESVKDALCARGRWGQKTKAGFYDYDDKRRSTSSPEVIEIIDAFRARAGVVARSIDEEEVIARTLYPMINEGAKILDEGIAQRASDIDVVWAHGYGWPRHKGGPMFWAEQTGLATILAGLERYADRMGDDFQISPYLRLKAASGAF